MITNPSTTPAWDDSTLGDPHAAPDKRQRVRRMFAAIAPAYDLNNRLHSLWQDQRWRRAAAKLAGVGRVDTVVDVACGTGDLTLAMERSRPDGPTETAPGATIGIDFTFEMLPLARAKAMASAADAGVRFINGDAQSLPLPDGACDVVSIAFGIRNVQEPARALAEFFRVLRPGGRLVILEFSRPDNRLLAWLNRIYTEKLMPRTATWISGDRSGAYAYLPRSVGTFMSRQAMADAMAAAGFADVTRHPLTFGVCVAYRGVKK